MSNIIHKKCCIIKGKNLEGCKKLNSKKGKNYLTGAAIIAAGGLIAKFLGIFFKIPIDNIIGSYGFGLYSFAYPLYSTFLSISVIGLPVAVSKMIAERMSRGDYFNARKVFRLAFMTLAILGAVGSLVMFFGANFFIKIFKWDVNAYYSIVALSIAPFFVTIISAFRGYFQGMQLMSMSSISQIIEQIGRVAVGVFLAWYLTEQFGVVYGAAGAVFGAVVGAILAFFFLQGMYVYQNKKEKTLRENQKNIVAESTKSILKTLLIISIPITLGGMITTVMDLINSVTISDGLLKSGLDQVTVTELYGILEQKAQTLINVPLIIGSALSASLVPSISASFAKNDKLMARKKVSLAIRVAFIIGIPSSIGLSVLSEPIISLLFGTSEGGDMLGALAYVVIFTIGMTSLQGILQGAGKFYQPLINMAIGTIVKLVLNLWWLPNPELGIFGAIYSSIVASAVIFLLNLYQVKKHIGFNNVWISVTKSFVAALIMGVVARFIYDLINVSVGSSIAVLVAILVAMLVYFVIIVISKAFTREDFQAVRE